MRFEDLPGPMQDAFESLKHGSATIEADIQDALESADSLEDFCSRAETALNSLIEEAVGMRIAFSRCRTEPVVLDAVKFLEWVNTRQMIAGFDDLEKFKTLWDVPDIILPRHVFVSGFDTACKLLSHDSSIVRIADQSTKSIPVKWANVPKGVSS